MSSNAEQIWGMLHLINCYRIYVSILFLLAHFSIYSQKYTKKGQNQPFHIRPSLLFDPIWKTWGSKLLKLSTRQDESNSKIISVLKDIKVFYSCLESLTHKIIFLGWFRASKHSFFEIFHKNDFSINVSEKSLFPTFKFFGQTPHLMKTCVGGCGP